MSYRPTIEHKTPPSVPPVRGIERGTYLMIATPVLTTLATLETHLVHARLCDPNGAARHTLEHVVEQLRDAVARAEELELWGGIDDVVELTGRSKSTVTEWAQKYGDGVWCWKKSGVWAVDLRKFDAWYRSNLPALERRRREPGDGATADRPRPESGSPLSLTEAA